MGLFTKNESKEMLDKYLKKYINEDILFDGKKKDDEEEEDKKKSKKGITLLTLVITIIVMLILTGITLSATFSNNGILNGAYTAGKFTPENMNNTYVDVANALKEKGVIEDYITRGANIEVIYKGMNENIVLNPILDEIIQKNQLNENNIKNIF